MFQSKPRKILLGTPRNSFQHKWQENFLRQNYSLFIVHVLPLIKFNLKVKPFLYLYL